MTAMDWQQKAEAMSSLSELSVHIREPGNWYARLPRVEIKEGIVLTSACGNGNCPEAAVENLWDQVAAGQTVVVSAMSNRRVVRWNKYMWQDIPE